MAITASFTVNELAEVDFAYALPYSSANDPLNIAAFAASNARSGYCPLASFKELSSYANAASIPATKPIFLDVRTYGEFQREHLASSLHIPLDELRDRLEEVPNERAIRVISSGGYEGHLATRLLIQKGYTNVANCCGSWAVLRLLPGISIERT